MPTKNLGFALEPAALALAVIDLDGTRNAVAIGAHCLKTLFDDAHHLVPFPFQAGAHWPQAVRHAAVRDEFQRPGNVGADALPLVHR